MTNEESAPKLHIDSDWKAQAQAEKERLAEKEKQAAGDTPKRGPHQMPDADFRSLIGVLASQAMMGLGAYGDPSSGKVMVDLDGARFAIDLLGVIEEKSKGNLSDEEADELRQVQAELRSRFVQITNLLAQQADKSGGGQPDAAGAPPTL